MRTAIIVALVLASACSVEPWPRGSVARPEVVGTSDPVVLADWRVAVEQAMLVWSGALGDDCTFPIRIAEPDEEACPIRLVDPKFWLWDDADGVEDDCYINVKGIDPWGKRLILEHELGHAIGLEHAGDKTSVMFTHAGPEITDDNIKAARVALGCTEER